VQEGILQELKSIVLQTLRKCSKNAQIRRAFQVEHPPFLLGEVVLVKTDLLKSLCRLVASIIDTMRVPNEGNDNIMISSLVQHYLGMARSDNLTLLTLRNIGQKIIGLPLSQDFKVSVWLIKK
jgi:hypothetical protein